MTQMRIKKIVGNKLYEGLLIGRPKGSMFEDELNKMKADLGNVDPKHQAVLVTEKQDLATGIPGKYVTYGMLGGANVTFVEDDGIMNEVSIIWHYVNEFTNVEESLNEALLSFDWKEIADIWDIIDF